MHMDRPRIDMIAIAIEGFFKGDKNNEKNLTVERHDRISEPYLTKADGLAGAEAAVEVQVGLNVVRIKQEKLEGYFQKLRSIVWDDLKAELPEKLNALDVKMMDQLSEKMMSEVSGQESMAAVLNRLGTLSEGFGQLQLAENDLIERMETLGVESDMPREDSAEQMAAK